jgi:hypothetical protein
VDDTGTILSQGDGPPCQGRYPTTSWAAGEHLDDPHTLELPADTIPGTYHLLVGLYDPQKGTRLPLIAGGDSVRLEQGVTVHR